MAQIRAELIKVFSGFLRSRQENSRIRQRTDKRKLPSLNFAVSHPLIILHINTMQNELPLFPLNIIQKKNKLILA
jgi:hypothetical protein